MTDYKYNTISLDDTIPGKKEEVQQQTTRSSFLKSLDRTAVVIVMLSFLSGAACMNVWSSTFPATTSLPDSTMMEASLLEDDGDVKYGGYDTHCMPLRLLQFKHVAGIKNDASSETCVDINKSSHCDKHCNYHP